VFGHGEEPAHHRSAFRVDLDALRGPHALASTRLRRPIHLRTRGWSRSRARTSDAQLAIRVTAFPSDGEDGGAHGVRGSPISKTV
jgi:hypothetical protein